jgi:hypothetical protein
MFSGWPRKYFFEIHRSIIFLLSSWGEGIGENTRTVISEVNGEGDKALRVHAF